MNAKKEWIGSKEVATKGDLEDLREELQVDIVTAIRESEDRLNKKLELVLEIAQDTNIRVAELQKSFQDIPEKVATLEDDVLRLKAKVF